MNKLNDNTTLGELRKMRWKDTDDFVKLMEKFIQRYREDVKENGRIKEWKDERFIMWHIIKDAYDAGHNYADNYWIDIFWELSNAEYHFTEKIRDSI